MDFIYEILEDFIQSVVAKPQFFARAKKKCATTYFSMPGGRSLPG